MKKYSVDLIVFDLDGTLIDSARDIATAVNLSLGHFRLPKLPDELIASLVGEGAPVLLRRALDAVGSDLDVEVVLPHWRRFYTEHALDTTTLCAGTKETLEQFRDKQLAVLTNKPAAPSVQILRGLGIEDSFFLVVGGDTAPARKPDPIGLRLIIENAAADHARTVLVGDSGIDVDTARNAGVLCCTVRGMGEATIGSDRGDVFLENLSQMEDFFE